MKGLKTVQGYIIGTIMDGVSVETLETANMEEPVTGDDKDELKRVRGKIVYLFACLFVCLLFLLFFGT